MAFDEVVFLPLGEEVFGIETSDFDLTLINVFEHVSEILGIPGLHEQVMRPRNAFKISRRSLLVVCPGHLLKLCCVTDRHGIRILVFIKVSVLSKLHGGHKPIRNGLLNRSLENPMGSHRIVLVDHLARVDGRSHKKFVVHHSSLNKRRFVNHLLVSHRISNV